MSVFISYSHKDAGFVDRLAIRLLEHNIKVWKDAMKIIAGDSFVNKIKAGIEGASYFCIVLSQNALKSKWVKKEINQALIQESKQKGIGILPILIDDCEIPPLLSDRIFVDFRKDFHSGLIQILSVVGKKYNIDDSGRSATDTNYYFDYGIEQRFIDGRYFMQVDVVSYDSEEEFSILSQFKFYGNEHATREHFGLEEDESLRNYVLRACAQEFSVNPARIKVNTTDAKRAQLSIQDAQGVARFDVDVRVKWLGTASRETLLFNVGALFGQICALCGIDINQDDISVREEDCIHSNESD